MSVRVEDKVRIKEQAREWLVRQSLGAPSAQERTDFDAWRDADPRHAAAYRSFERVWNEVPQIASLRDTALLEETPPRTRRYGSRRWFAIAAMIAAIAVAVFVALPSRTVLSTGLAEVDEVLLPDGTHVTLGGKSALKYTFDAAARRVTLIRGEAFFDVAQDRNRPFTVDIGRTQVRVVGTRFNVRRGAQEVRIAVLDGKVAVSQDDAPVMLSAGEQAKAGGSGVVAIRNTASAQAAAGTWRTGRLEYVDTPLREVIADVNRYSPTPVEFGRADLGALLVSTTFRTDQIDDLLETLAETLPLQVSREVPGRIVLAPRDPPGG